MKKIIFTWLTGTILLSMPAFLWADTLVFIPGFQATGKDWRFSGVTEVLEQADWQDGGNFTMNPAGIANSVRLSGSEEKVFYTLDLPTSANIQEQAKILDYYLQAVYQQRQEPLILIGHSAGGVVARHWLVKINRLPVSTLITIATPHLGTPLTELSQLLGNRDIANLMEALGLGFLQGARGLFSDLRDERPGTYLYWLNRQPHPELRYVSIVRNSEKPDSADIVVPRESQDMNQVIALRRRAERWNSNSPHYLEMSDGHLLLKILEIIPL